MLATLIQNTRLKISRASRRREARDKDFWWWEDVDFKTPRDNLMAEQADTDEAPVSPPPYEPEPRVNSALSRL